MGYFIALFLLLIIASLASAGFFMLRRPPEHASDDDQKIAKQRGMVDFNSSLVRLVEEEYIAIRVAEDSSPNVDEFRMILKKLGK